MKGKRWTALLTAGLILLAAAGCGNKQPAESAPTEPEASAAEPAGEPSSEEAIDMGDGPITVMDESAPEDLPETQESGGEEESEFFMEENADMAGLDASGYVKALLDAQFLNNPQAYQEMLGVSAGEVQEVYQQSVSFAVENLLAQYNCADASETVRARAAKLFELLYPQVNYQVGEARLGDNLYTVPVTISPLDLFSAHVDEISAYMEKAGGKTGDAFMEGFLDLAEGYAASVGYEPAQTIEVSVVQDTGGSWQLDPDDNSFLCATVITY